MTPEDSDERRHKTKNQLVKGERMSNVSTIANKTLMAQARTSLDGKWKLSAGTTLLFFVTTIAIQMVPGVGPFIAIALTGPLAVGFAMFILSVTRNEAAKSSQLFDGFNRFGVAFGAHLLQFVLVALWSLLLVVPGIIAGISYSMTYYIIADDKTIGPLEAISKSKAMMYGNKWKFACLSARFIGWTILAALTLGIGMLWLTPYAAASIAQFYEELVRVETGSGMNPMLATNGIPGPEQ